MQVPMLAVGLAQTVQIHAYGRILAAAVRNGHGWNLTAGGRTHESAPSMRR